MNFMYKSNLTIHYYKNIKIKHVVDKLKGEVPTPISYYEK